MTSTLSQPKTFELQQVQDALAAEGVDGWLFYFFHDNDPIALRILGLSAGHFVSRRWFYYVPASGTPIKLVHRIEMDSLDAVPGDKVVYLGWKELESKLKEVLAGQKKVAMQYSPGNAIPYVSRVDAGTVELVRSAGCEVVTSANLVSYFEARLSPVQLQTHIEAVEALKKIVFEAFEMIKTAIKSSKRITEYDVQQFIVESYERYGLTSNSPPIVAVNGHAGQPHYQPTETMYDEIRLNDFVLLDIWAKKKSPEDAVYGDITWTGYVGTDVPRKFVDVFEIVRDARDAALTFVRGAAKEGREIKGWQVDDAARGHIASKGYEKFFVHRTGHSICTEVHANGANIDNLETRDERKIIAKTAFSIEPGIYLDDFGVRSEIDVYVDGEQVIVAGQPIQTEIVKILAD
ncbi:MAG: M24 family metallopeptidase [Candidatus Obscuribacterales bacterium]